MKILMPLTPKRILAIVLGIILLAFAAFMLFTPGQGDTIQEQRWMGIILFAISTFLTKYGFFGGKEP